MNRFNINLKLIESIQNLYSKAKSAVYYIRDQYRNSKYWWKNNQKFKFTYYIDGLASSESELNSLIRKLNSHHSNMEWRLTQ